MRRKSILGIGSVILCGVLLFSACGQKETYLLGTGNEAGNYYAYGNTLSELLEQNELEVDVKKTAGSAANLRLLQKGFLDMAIVQSDTLLDAYRGKGDFLGNECTGVRAVAGLYTEECQVIVAADSDIYSIADLYEKKVSIGEEESGVKRNAIQILDANGIKETQIVAYYLSFSDSADALKSGEIDAFFMTAGAPTVAALQLAEKMDIRILSLDDKTCQKLMKEYPSYTKCVIPAGTYPGQTEDADTVGVKAVLVVGNKMPNRVVSKISECLFANVEKLRTVDSEQVLSKEYATEAIPIPFHKGAANWYEGQGVQVSTTEVGSTGFFTGVGQD